jgi:sporulation protein YlmC with PRC-barrel domain
MHPASRPIADAAKGAFTLEEAMKKFATAVALAALLAVPAIAQEPPKKVPAPTTVDRTTNYSGQISASELLNENVVNAANEKVGDINDILIDSNGKVAGVIVGVGGFLGMGEKDVSLTFDQLTFASDANDPLVVKTDATKESLQAAPEYVRPDKRT